MKKIQLYIVSTLLLLLTACSEPQNEADQPYAKQINAAWDYIVENDWENRIAGGKEDATAEKIEATNTYELFDASLRGKEVIRVTFPDQVNSVVGAPILLVSEEGEVVGFLASE